MPRKTPIPIKKIKRRIPATPQEWCEKYAPFMPSIPATPKDIPDPLERVITNDFNRMMFYGFSIGISALLEAIKIDRDDPDAGDFLRDLLETVSTTVVDMNEQIEKGHFYWIKEKL